MKKQNTKYSTFTSYLSKTNKNVDMYRLITQCLIT